MDIKNTNNHYNRTLLQIKEIAKELGYASHSPVVKRLQRLKQQFLMFMAQIKGA